MKIRAFHGLRYNGTARAAGALAAPPYDQIDDRLRDELQAASASHFAHLIRPVQAGSTSAHERSAHLHTTWLAEGVIRRDEEPRLYGNVIESPTGSLRLGLTALVDIEPTESGVIRPHEETVDKTVAERLGLLRTTRVDFEPILVLANDEGLLEKLLDEERAAAELVATHTDEFGNTHHLFPIADPARIALYREALIDAYGLIADGHHRYKTAGLWAEESRAEAGTAAAAKLAVITSLSSTALTIDPIHRALPFSLAAARTAAHSCEPWPGSARSGDQRPESTGSELARAVAVAEQPALGVLAADGSAEIWRLDPEQGPDDLPPAASRLAVVLLHRTLLPRCGVPQAAATDGTIAYRSKPDDLLAAVTAGHFETGVVLPPMTPRGFAAGIANGDVLPPKSTRFLPKVVSGLVWADHTDPVA